MSRRRSEPPQARWVLGVGMPWYQRAGLILLLLVIVAMSGFGEVAALVVGWSILGAITGLRPGELRAVPLWPRRPVQVATALLLDRGPGHPVTRAEPARPL